MNVAKYLMNNQAVIAYAANQPQTVRLLVSGFVRALWLELTGTLNVTVLGTAVNRTPGTLVPTITTMLNGTEIYHSGRWNDWVDRGYMFFKAPAQTAATGGVASTAIASRIRLPFITPWAVRPSDTVLYLTNNDRLEVQVTWADENSQVTGGTKAWTTNPQITVIPEVTTEDGQPIAKYKELALDSNALGVAANTDLNIPLTVGPKIAYHHLGLVAEDIPAAGRVPVTTLLNSVQLRQTSNGFTSQPFGPMTGSQIANEYDTYFNRAGVQTGIYPVVFQPRYDGRTNFNLDTSDLSDLRWIINHAGFTTDGRIRTLIGRVERF